MEQTDASPHAWSVKRLADAWDVSTSTIYKMIDEGKLKTFPIGRRGLRIADGEKRRWESESQATETATAHLDDGAQRRVSATQMKALASVNG